MPVVIDGLLGAVDLVAIALLLVVVGMLYSVKWWLRPAFSVLSATIGHIPGVGGFVTDAENAVIGALDDAIKATEGAAAKLWRGLELLVTLTGDALHALAADTEKALRALWHSTIPTYVKAELAPVLRLANAAKAKVDQLAADVVRQVDRLDARITSQAEATLRTAEHYAAGEVNALAHTVTGEIDQLRATLEAELGTAVTGARESAQAALDRLRAAEEAAVAQAEAIAQGAQSELEQLQKAAGAAGLAALIAALPATLALVRSIADEAGLGNPECRTKVKGICRTPTSSWLRLLESLALAASLGDIHDLIRLVEDGAKVVMPEVERLVA